MKKIFCLSILFVFSSSVYAMEHTDDDHRTPVTIENSTVDLENPHKIDPSEYNFTKRQKQIACIACSSCLAVTILGTLAGKILYGYYTHN